MRSRCCKKTPRISHCGRSSSGECYDPSPTVFRVYAPGSTTIVMSGNQANLTQQRSHNAIPRAAWAFTNLICLSTFHTNMATCIHLLQKSRHQRFQIPQWACHWQPGMKATSTTSSTSRVQIRDRTRHAYSAVRTTVSATQQPTSFFLSFETNMVVLQAQYRSLIATLVGCSRKLILFTSARRLSSRLWEIT